MNALGLRKPNGASRITWVGGEVLASLDQKPEALMRLLVATLQELSFLVRSWGFLVGFTFHSFGTENCCRTFRFRRDGVHQGFRLGTPISMSPIPPLPYTS